MELVLKQPINKPKFIGVCFDSGFKASTINQEFVNELKDSPFYIIIEPIGLNLRLVCESPFRVYEYFTLKHDKAKLKQWLEAPKEFKHYNFSHLTKEYDNYTVVKTLKERKLFVLKIDSVRINE